MKNGMTRLVALIAVLAMVLSFAPAIAETKADYTHVTIFQNSGSAGQNYLDEDIERVAAYIAEQTGTWIDVIIPVVGAETDSLNVLLASGEKVNAFVGDWRTYAPKNVLRPIDYSVFNVIAEKLDAFYPDWKAITADSEGNTWCIPQVNPQAGYPLQIRADWVEKLGMQLPTTIDELEAILAAFKEHAAELTEGDMVPLLTYSDIAQLRMAFAAGWLPENEAGNWISEDGKVMPVQLHENYKAFIEKMADWYAKGYIYSDSFSIGMGDVRSMIPQNRVGAFAGWHSGINMASTNDYDLINSYAIIPNLQGPEGNVQILNGTLSSCSGSGTVITASTTDEEYQALANLLNWTWTARENFFSLSKGVPGVDFEFNAEADLDGYEGFTILNETLYAQANIVPFQIAANYWHTTQGGMLSAEGTITPAYAYNFNHIIKDIPYCKVSGDFYVAYDKEQLLNVFPNLDDINTMIAAEETKFVTGARPLTEWDAYINELYSAGLDKWIDAYTAQYQASLAE